MENLAVPAGDLAPKYQKLAAEYTKLRVHVKVLKKGVLEEQARTAELRALLRDRERDMRKSELEIDSLQFRNAQLAKRIAVLQDELQAEQNKLSKKGRGKGAPGTSQEETRATVNSDLLQEELQKKIFENAQYSSQLSDSTMEISQLRASLADYEKLMAESEARYRCEVAKLKHQNQEIQYQLDELVKERNRNKQLSGIGQPASCNGDMLSDVASLVDSEDALSSVVELPGGEQLCVKTQQLEQENERLKMECELVAMENEGLKLEVMRHSAGRERHRRDSAELAGYSDPRPDLNGLITTPLAALQVPFDLSEEIRCREERLTQYFRAKITELTAQRQELEAKALHYIRECELLRLRYEEAEREHELTDQNLQHKHDTITRLEEELQSTTHNYAEQISLLSEHIADLTDQLSRQHTELERLRARRK